MRQPAQEVLAPFRNAGLHIVAPDRPRCGSSYPLPRGQRGSLAQSIWLKRLVDALGFASLTMVGLSLVARRLFFWRSGGLIW
jgi:pimeloyl-ACP methyl ester carboxylesterase